MQQPGSSKSERSVVEQAHGKTLDKKFQNYQKEKGLARPLYNLLEQYLEYHIKEAKQLETAEKYIST